VNFFSGGLAAWRLKIFDAVGAVGSRKGLPYCNTHCGRATGCAQLQLVPLDRVFRGHSIDVGFVGFGPLFVGRSAKRFFFFDPDKNSILKERR
jgi:hypothetical protein